MSISARIPGSPRGSRGFTMVEAMIALLVLSIGLLGIAALQMTGMRNNLSASWRSQATYLAYDILDRMRANRTNRVNYQVGWDEVPTCSEGDAVSACDLNRWKGNLSTVLPGGDGTVTVGGTDNTEITVTIRWDDSRGQDAELLVFRTRSRI